MKNASSAAGLFRSLPRFHFRLPLLLLAGACAIAAATAAAANTAVEPESRGTSWENRHKFFVDIASQPKPDCQVLFLGDSITDFWRDRALGVWEKNFGHYGAENFGISGDRTQHLLWRLQNGEIGNLRPKVIVLMIGTNNTGFENDKTTRRNTPAEAAEGVKAVVAYLREKLPDAKILLLAVFPRGEKDDPQRAEVSQINDIISKLNDGRSVFYLDINKNFLFPDGTLPRDIMPDLLHPSLKGYQIWAAAIKDPLAKLAK